MALATTRLNSINRLREVFDRASEGNNAGAWAVQASGSTPEADTGPGANSGGPYIYCHAAGATTEAQIQANSMLTLRDYLVDEWTGTGRILALTYCVTGAAFDTTSEGIEIETLVNGAWGHRAIIDAWPYSDTAEDGDLVTTLGGIQHTIDEDGNWIGLRFTIADDVEGLRFFLDLDNKDDLAKSNVALWDIALIGGPTTELRAVEDYRLLVDWDNDNSYGNVNADVWPRVIEGTFNCRRGRNFASQRVGRSRAGTLEVQLDNRDGLFDPDNTASALHGLLGSGRRVRWQMNDGNDVESQWTGWLDKIEQVDAQSGFDRVRIRAYGVLSKIRDREKSVNVDQQTAITTGVAGRLLFDPDGTRATGDHFVDGVDYRASYIQGAVTMARWWASRGRLDELRDLEQTESGFIWEPKDGFVAMDNASKRQLPSASTSRATFTDGIPGTGEIPVIRNGIEPDHPLEDLANVITSEVRPYTVGAVEVLWSVDGLAIPAGNTSIIVRVPHAASGMDIVGVDSWTDLTSGVDYTPQAGVTLTMTTAGNAATIAIANTGTDTTMDIQVRGEPVVRADPIEITSTDPDSIQANGGEYPYPFPTPWLANPAQVKVLHNILLRLYASPAERLTLTWEAESDRAKAASLDLSDRVTVDRRGQSAEYFIESIRHRLTADEYHFITMTLSPAEVYGTLFVIGVSRYGEDVLVA